MTYFLKGLSFTKTISKHSASDYYLTTRTNKYIFRLKVCVRFSSYCGHVNHCSYKINMFYILYKLEMFFFAPTMYVNCSIIKILPEFFL